MRRSIRATSVAWPRVDLSGSRGPLFRTCSHKLLSFPFVSGRLVVIRKPCFGVLYRHYKRAANLLDVCFEQPMVPQTILSQLPRELHPRHYEAREGEGDSGAHVRADDGGQGVLRVRGHARLRVVQGACGRDCRQPLERRAVRRGGEDLHAGPVQAGLARLLNRTLWPLSSVRLDSQLIADVDLNVRVWLTTAGRAGWGSRRSLAPFFLPPNAIVDIVRRVDSSGHCTMAFISYSRKNVVRVAIFVSLPKALGLYNRIECNAICCLSDV